MNDPQYGDHGEVLDNDTGESLPAIATNQGLQAITVAEIDQAVATAKRYPRRRDKEISNEIMGRATLDEDTADKCNYLLPRGGKKIPGPSIRFAEIVRASYWNIRVAARFVALDTTDMERAATIVEAIALDLETNQSEVIPIRRSIMTSGKRGERPQIYSADMIAQTTQAAISFARRNAILTVVPQVLWMAGYRRVVEVLRGTVETLGARRVAMIEAFGRAGVSPQALFDALDIRDENDINIDHMPTIRAMLTAIKEGEPVDSVLSRSSLTEAQPHRRVASPPLQDRPSTKTDAPDERREVPAGSDPRAGTKDDPISSGPARAAVQQPAEAEPAKPQGSAEPAQKPAAAPAKQQNGGPPTYNDEDSLLAFLRWHFQNTKVPTALKAVWGDSRTDRRELLSADANAKITGEYNAAMTALI
jgi:hypothetical protein